MSALILASFNLEFKGKADDRELMAKLTGEAPGILNWLLKGCSLWQHEGLEPTPECIDTATREYEADSDPLSQFILDDCVITPQAQCKSSDIYRHYTEWCSGQGYRDKEILTTTAFGRRMGQKFKKTHNRGGTVYFGVGSVCDGFVTGSDTDDIKNELSRDLFSCMGDKGEKPSQPVNPSLLDTNPQEYKNTTPFNEFPANTCPICHTDEKWELHPNGFYCCGQIYQPS